MATGPMNHVLTHLRRAALLYELRDLTDGQLLERFLARQDEQAFTALVRRHGPMVLGVCQRVLRNEQDAEDAFQSTFLVLARKGSSVVPSDRVGHWLYGVAYRTALKARTAAARRRRVERQACQARGMPGRAEDAADDLRSLLDEELRRLPGKYGTPLVLCLLEGKTRKEAARILGWTEGTLSGRLARAKTLLAARLARRGLPLAGASLALPFAATAARASVPAPLSAAAVKAALSVAAGRQVVGTVSAQVIALTEEVLKAMLLTKLKVVTAIVLVVSIGICGGMVACHSGAVAGGESGHLHEGTAQGWSLLSRQMRANPPPYVIEPPDLLTVDARRLVPLQPYHLAPLDALFLSVSGTNEKFPICEGIYQLDPEGTLDLGLSYGRISLVGLTVDEIKVKIEQELKKQGNTAPLVKVSLHESRALQQIRGEHLVRTDGTINLGSYGNVYVTGMTIEEAKKAIEAQLSKLLLNPEVSVEILASNSKFYELITEDDSGKEQVWRLPLAGNDTVLNVLSRWDDLWLHAFNKHIWIIRRPVGKGDTEKTLFVDWAAVTQRGITATNYPLFPRDRIYVKAAAPKTVDDASGSRQPGEDKAGQAKKDLGVNKPRSAVEHSSEASASERAKKALSRIVYLDIEYPSAIEHKSALGIVVDRQGYILSTYAPLKGAKRVRARFGDGSILDSNSWVFDESGLARIRLEKPLPWNQPVVKFADPESTGLGEAIWVARIGNGNTGTLILRPAVVAALNREVMTEQKRRVKGVIQVDQQVDAGSPLINREGELVGICLSASEKGVSVGLAMPSERAEEACNNLRR